MDDPQIYRPPANHDNDIKKMGLYLTAGILVFVVIVILFVAFADKLAKKIPFSAEQQFVKPYEKILSKYFSDSPLPEEKAIERYISDMVADISVQMALPKDHAVKVHYINDGTTNAFVTLGGHMFIFRGLLESMPDENSLAMVVAHELAHIKNRDPLAAMGRGFAIQLAYSFVTGDYSSGLGLQVDGGEIGLLYFSREQESTADIMAINTLASRYGHVQGFDTFFRSILEDVNEESMNEKSSIDIDEWLATHPSLKKRIERLEQYAKEHNYKTQGRVVSLPVWLKENMELIKKARRLEEIKKDHG